MIRRVAVAVATVAALAAIVLAGGRVFRSEEWVDARGRSARDVLVQRTGEDHCSWGGIPVLVVGEPLGTPFSPATRFYYRDTDGLLAGKGILLSTFAVMRSAPPGAKPTGYRSGSRRLWRGEDAGAEAVYLVEEKAGRAERWPRLRPGMMCK